MVCIGIALIFWFFVKLSKPYETIREVNVQYMLPEGKAFVEVPPDIIKATLNGRGWDLFSDYITHSSPAISFDVSNYPSLTIDRTQLFNGIKQTFSSEVKIVAADIDFIIFNYQDEAKKKVPVVLVDSISFEPGYNLKDSVVIFPDSVLVYGPYSLINNLMEWPTAPFKRENLKTTIQEEWHLKLPEQGQITLSPPKVVLTIPVEEFTEKSVYVPVGIKNGRDSIRIFPSQIEVNFIIGVSHFNEITAEDFLIETDFKNIALNDVNNTLPIQFTKIPNGISGLNYNPKSIEFYIVQKAANLAQTDSLNTSNNLKN